MHALSCDPQLPHQDPRWRDPQSLLPRATSPTTEKQRNSKQIQEKMNKNIPEKANLERERTIRKYQEW